MKLRRRETKALSTVQLFLLTFAAARKKVMALAKKKTLWLAAFLVLSFRVQKCPFPQKEVSLFSPWSAIVGVLSSSDAKHSFSFF